MKIGGALYVAGHALTIPIDAMAIVLTDTREYFWSRGSSTTIQQSEQWHKWDAIERWDEPWPR